METKQAIPVWMHELKRCRVADLEDWGDEDLNDLIAVSHDPEYFAIGLPETAYGIRYQGHIVVFNGSLLERAKDAGIEEIEVLIATRSDGEPITPEEFARGLRDVLNAEYA